MNNRTFSKLILIAFALIAFTVSYGQGYQRFYNDDDKDIVNYSNYPTQGGGFFLVNSFKGTATSLEPDSTGIFISRHNPKGNPGGNSEWVNSYRIDDAEYSISYKAMECATIGKDTLLVVAVEESTRETSGNKYLLKIDPAGELIWSSAMADISDDQNVVDYSSLAKVLAGDAGSFNYFGTHDIDTIVGIHFERLDSMNNSLVSRAFLGVNEDSTGTSAIRVSLVDAAQVALDSSFALTMSLPDDSNRAAVLQLDNPGRVMQAANYMIDDSLDYVIEFSSIAGTPDTGFIAVGFCEHNSLSDGIVVKLDSSLNVAWAKRMNLGMGTNNQAQDVVIGNTGQIVVAGKYLDASFLPGNYAVMMDLNGALINATKYESLNSMSIEFSTGLNASVDLNSVAADGTMLLSTTGAANRPLGISPISIKLSQDGAALCHDSLMVAMTDVPFARDTMLVIQGAPLARMEEVTVRTISENFDIPVVNLGQEPPFCPRDSLIHIFDASENLGAFQGTGNPPSYLWSTGDTTAMIEVDISMLEPGAMEEYAVTVTIDERICFTLCDTGAVSKTEFPMASIQFDPSRYCEFNEVGFSVGSSTNLDGGVVWDPDGETMSRITVPYVEGKEYSVTITDRCMDTAVATSTIPDLTPEPNVQFTVDNSALCENGVLFLRADWPSNEFGGFTYEWSPTGETAKEISISQGGTYSVTITDECNPAHVAMGSITIADDQFVIPDPTIVIEQGPLQSFGGNGCGIRLTAVSMLGDGASDIPGVDLIHGGDVNLVLDVTPESLTTDPQTFTAWVTQCGVQFDAVPVTLSSADLMPPLPTVNITQGGLNPVSCDLILTANGDGFGPLVYQWSNNVANQESTVNLPGTYTVTVTDACGQEQSAEIILGEDAFSVDDFQVEIVPMESGDLEGCQILLQALSAPGTTIPDGAQYAWSTGEVTSSIIVSGDGEFTVTVTSCDKEASGTYNRSFSDTFQWPNIFFPQSRLDDINRTFGPQLECPEAITGPYSLEIFNRWGKRVFEADNPAERWSGTLNNQGNFLDEDVYMYQWSYDGGEIMSSHVTLVRN